MPRVGGRHRQKGAPSERRVPTSCGLLAQTLDEIPAGVAVIICRLCGGRGLASRLLALGFTPGAEVTVVQNRGRGPIIVVARDVRVALGRGEAQKIEVAAR